MFYCKCMIETIKIESFYFHTQFSLLTINSDFCLNNLLITAS